MKKHHEVNNTNSSDDSVGEDLSFDDGDKKTTTSDNEDLISWSNLREKYDNYKQNKTVNQKYSKSKWTYVYNAFFSHTGNKVDNISLNELDLRCKLMSKRDENQNDNKNKKGNETVAHLPSHSNIKQLIDKYSVTSRPNPEFIIRDSLKFKRGPTRKRSVEIRKNDNFGIKLPPKRSDSLIDIIKGLKKTNTSSLNELKIFMQKIGSLPNLEEVTEEGSNASFTQVEVETNKTIKKRITNLIELYDIKDAPIILQNIMKKNRKNKDHKNNLKIDEENFNNLLSNKNTYQVELDTYSSILKTKPKNFSGYSISEFDHLINFREAEQYFEILGIKKQKKRNKIKFHGDLEKVNSLYDKVNRIKSTIIDKIDQKNKINI